MKRFSIKLIIDSLINPFTEVKHVKYAILNPQLEHFYSKMTDEHSRMAMLFQHRFLLRAEHYCTPSNKKLKDCLRMKDIRWILFTRGKP